VDPRHTTRLPLGLAGGPVPARIKDLRGLLEAPGAVIAPGVSDAIGARLVEQAGFSLCYVTGAGIANSQLGVPDIGLVTLNEVVEQTRRIVNATNLPVLVDADTGHGGPLSVVRTVQMLEQAGAAGLQLEDQSAPKRCGHFPGKRLST
jgi:2-methylisocitrate lyase-like PEP mutase family enzyme